MVYGENTTVVQYELKARRNRPRACARDPAADRLPRLSQHNPREWCAEPGAWKKIPDSAAVTPYQGLPSLYLAHNAVELQKTGDWYRNFEYDVERERGLDFTKTCSILSSCVSICSRAARPLIIASTEPRDVGRGRAVSSGRDRAPPECDQGSPLNDDLPRPLPPAADQYIVARGDQKTVIAGYHWFSDWGRDTMIALPGLTLPTGQHDVRPQHPAHLRQACDQGMLPNRFPDAGETPEYNTVDATLWFFEAARAYLAYTGDDEFVRTELYPVFDRHHRLARARHALRNQSRSQRTAGIGRARRSTYLDGRQSRRLGGHSAPRQAGRDPGALVQRALHHGGTRRANSATKPSQKRYRNMAAMANWAFQSPVLE